MIVRELYNSYLTGLSLLILIFMEGKKLVDEEHLPANSHNNGGAIGAKI